MSVRYCYSTCSEVFTGDFPSREEAAMAAVEDACIPRDGDTTSVWTGTCHPHTASEFYDGNIDLLLEELGERAWEHADERSETWLSDVTQEQKDALEQKIRAAIDQWATEHGHQPLFYEVDEVEEHSVGLAEDRVTVLLDDEVLS